MAQGDTGIETVSAADGVRVERSVERKESGLTAEYEIRSLAGSPLRFRVREPLDPETDVDEIGFHPEYEPEEWSIEERAVVFEGIASPDDAFRTVLGAVVGTGEFLVADPEVERVVRETGEESDEGSAGGGVLAGIRARLFGTNGEAAAEPAGDGAAVTIDRSAEADGGDPADRGVLADVEAGLASEEEPGSESGSGGESGDSGAAKNPESDEDSATEAPREPVAREAESATEAVGGDPGDEPTDKAGTDAAESGRGDGAEDDDSVQFDRDATDTGTERDSADLVAAVREDEALREDLRDALGVAGESDGRHGSVDVRLRHVQSRVDDLAAYTDALEEAIDEHGRPAEVLADLREETAALGEQMADVRGETSELREDVAEVREEVAAVREQQETTRERVEDLAGATEELRADLEDTRDRHGSRIDRVESDVDGVAADVRVTRDDVESDLADLRSEVADLQEMRETLSAAFAAVGARERTDGDEGEREAKEEGEQERDREREQAPVTDVESESDDGQ